jgi:hypothetical protein
MKFAILALLGLVTINAVKLHQKSLAREMPSAAEIFEKCDANNNDLISK